MSALLEQAREHLARHNRLSGSLATEREFRRHDHSAAAECTGDCPAFDLSGWSCSRCARQRPMAADTEDWASPLCDGCFLEVGHVA